MAFIRKQDNGGGEQFKFEKQGQTLTGWYLGSFDHTGDFGPTKKHLFKLQTGQIKVVFGQTHLTQLLCDAVDPIPTGALVQVTFSESKKMKKGNPMKMYTVDVDADSICSVDDLAAVSRESDDYSDESDDETQADEVITAPAKAAPKAASPTAKSRAQVEALLSGNKRA